MALTPEQIDVIANEYLVGLFQEMEQDVISDIARRVRKTGRLTETAELMAQNLANQGYSPAEIRVQVMQMLNADPQLQAEIAKNTLEYKKAVTERIDQLVEDAREAGDELVANAGRMCFNDDLALWREAGKELNNTALPQIISSIQAQTQGAMRNLTQTTALALRDASGVQVPIMDGYKRFLDKTTLQVATGTFSYDEAVNRTIKEMAKSGIRYVEYHSTNGRVTMTELDVAARRAVRTGVSQMAGKIMEENVRNSDTDLVITSQHIGSRPEHAEWQNKIFSLTGKSKRYKSLADGTGYGTVTGLKGANCTHNFYPYWPGISIKEPDVVEPPPVKINGREYTYYQATQKQREYERKLRAAKREIAIQEQSGGDPKEIAKLKNEARALSKEYNSFSNAAGIRPKPNRARVVGVDRGSKVPTTPAPKVKKFTNPYTGKVIDVEESKFSLMRETCGDEFVDEFIKKLEECDDLTQALFHRYGDRLVIADHRRSGGAYFSDGETEEKGIYFNAEQDTVGDRYKKPFQIISHESGHVIDHLLNDVNGGSEFGRISNNEELYRLIKSEGKAFEKRCYEAMGYDKKPSQRANYILDDGIKKLLMPTDEYPIPKPNSDDMLAFNEWFSGYSRFKDDAKGSIFGVFDILESTSSISSVSAGHGLKYWGKESTGEKRYMTCTEFMAHRLESGFAHEQYGANMREAFPESWEALDRLLWGMLT